MQYTFINHELIFILNDKMTAFLFDYQQVKISFVICHFCNVLIF